MLFLFVAGPHLILQINTMNSVASSVSGYELLVLVLFLPDSKSTVKVDASFQCYIFSALHICLHTANKSTAGARHLVLDIFDQFVNEKDCLVV